jgi:hypothetical protein
MFVETARFVCVSPPNLSWLPPDRAAPSRADFDPPLPLLSPFLSLSRALTSNLSVESFVAWNDLDARGASLFAFAKLDRFAWRFSFGLDIRSSSSSSTESRVCRS